MGTRVGERANWQAESTINEGSRQEGASVIRLTVKAVYLRFDSNALYADRIESLFVQN